MLWDVPRDIVGVKSAGQIGRGWGLWLACMSSREDDHTVSGCVVWLWCFPRLCIGMLVMVERYCVACLRNLLVVQDCTGSCKWRDRGIYSIWGRRSLYCLYFGIRQLIGPEACFDICVRVLFGWLSNSSLYQIFSVNPSLLYQAVGMQAKDENSFQFDHSIWKVFWQRLLASISLFFSPFFVLVLCY